MIADFLRAAAEAIRAGGRRDLAAVLRRDAPLLLARAAWPQQCLILALFDAVPAAVAVELLAARIRRRP